MNTQGVEAAFAYCRENSLSMTVFEDMIALREDLRYIFNGVVFDMDRVR